MQKRTRLLDDWIYNQNAADRVCINHFHEIVYKVYTGYSQLDPGAPSQDDFRTKVALLMKAELILLGGDVIYVREGDILHTLGDSIDLLSYYMHADSNEVAKAISVLETNFQGYFPVEDGLVWRNVMCLKYPNGEEVFVNLRTLKTASKDMWDTGAKYPEFGVHKVNPKNYQPIKHFFDVENKAIKEPYFFEKTMMYHFNQPYREKSHVLVGTGGDGKSMFMGLINRLYGDFSLTDAVQPPFSGHAPAKAAYGFIGKRIVTFNDVGDPSSQFLEWLKRMITGKLEVKTPSGTWMTVPCVANFLMETNHPPQILSLEAHARRFVVRQFDADFRLKDHLTDAELDRLGDRGDITPADIINYILTIAQNVEDWTEFDPNPETLEWTEGVAE